MDIAQWKFINDPEYDRMVDMGIDIPLYMNFTAVHIDKQGKKQNPMPYQRLTQKDKWKPRAQKYYTWCNQIRGNWAFKYNQFTIMASKNQAFLDGAWWMYCNIFFKTKAHGDPDNVAKAINDALFENDKYVCGAYTYSYDTDNPRVEIEMLKLSRDRDGNPDIPSVLKLKLRQENP